MTFEVGRYTTEIEPDQPHPAGNATLDIVEWSARFGSEMVLCDGDGVPLADLRLQTSRRGVDFTAFVSWAGFDPADVHLADAGHEAYLPVLSGVRAAIDRYFAERAPDRPAGVVAGGKRQPAIPCSSGRELPSPAPSARSSMSRHRGPVLAPDDQRAHVPADLS